MIDKQTFMESAGNDLELAQNLLTLFEEQVQDGMNNLTDAVCTGNAALVASVAHKLVGSAVACGFIGLSEHLRNIELGSQVQISADIELQINNLKQIFEEERKEIGMLLGRGGKL